MAINGDSSASNPKANHGQLLLLLLLLGGTLAVLCHQGFLPYEVFFANDTALGAMKESSARLPGTFTGFWGDFWWIGGATPSSSPSLSTLFATVVSPEHYLKVYAPLTMLFFGFCVWFFFRQLRFSALASVVTALGAGLNMHFFSNGCWGLGTWTVCCGMVFVALGILVSPYIRPLWIKGVLAGLSVGMAVMEGFDVGAIMSVYVGLFLAFLYLFATSEPNPATRILRTLGAGTLVVLFSVMISACTLYTLVGTQISGMPTVGQTDREKQEHWEFTTQWSIPKIESLRVFIPGLFGYRMMEFTTLTNKAGSYWGKIAEDPHIEEMQSGDPKARAAAGGYLGMPQQVQDILAGNDIKTRDNIIDQLKARLQRRHSGSGEFTGVLVCLLAVFGVFSAARWRQSPFSTTEHRMVWFWAVAAVFSLLAAWGHHGFLYRFVYELPFFANIRNPMKFMHPLNVSLLILCGFGLEALHRSHLGPAEDVSEPKADSRLNWWKRTALFDKLWSIGTVLFLICAVVGFFWLGTAKPDLINYLVRNGFDSTLAPQIAGFCLGEVALFLLFLTLSAGTIIAILTGAWSGKRSFWAWIFLCAIMICDLYRADVPWIRYFNYQQKYTMNPVVDLLRHEPWEHRVVSRLSPRGPYDIGPDSNFGALCHWWLENDYPWNDIQSLEIDQAPRMPVLDSSYIGNFMVQSGNNFTPAARLWQLTNTRYIFADARLVPALNQLAEPRNSFRTIMRMDMVNKPGIEVPEDAGDMTVETNSTGAIALIEFTRALPRSKLYSNWRVLGDPETLKTLASTSFDPETEVIVAKDTPAAQNPASPGSDPGTVKIANYRAKDLILEANAKTPAVLLLNDRTGDGWSVTVDRQPAELLRCNYIMRGVFLPPGQHTVEFRFQAPLGFLYISVAAVLIGVFLGGYVIYRRFRCDPETPAETAP
jgi:hypothetical protein